MRLTLKALASGALVMSLLLSCGDTAPDPQRAPVLDSAPDLPPLEDAPDDLPRADSEPDEPPRTGARCEGLEAIETCVAGDCVIAACRGDEVCQDAACVPWTQASLSVDFSLTVDESNPQRALVQVTPGGFPRQHVDALRFDFGDGIAGWGESLSHVYGAPGVYAVTLEVRLSGYRVLTRRKRLVLSPPPDHNPLQLTVNQLPDALNGSALITLNNNTPDDPSDDVMHRFMVQVVRDRCDIDLTLLDDPGDPILPETLTLRALSARAEVMELSARIVLEQAEAPARARVVIDAANPLPEGVLTLTLSGTTQAGITHQRELIVEAVDLPPERDPFSRPMIWLLRDDMDLFTTSRAPISGDRYALNALPTPNGEPDLIEELRLMGAQGDDATINAAYAGWIKQAIVAETYRLFGIAPDGTPRDGIALRLVWSDDPDAPVPADFSPTGEVSIMRVGGAMTGLLGRSQYSAHNQSRVDNSDITLGLASGSVLSALTQTPFIASAVQPVNPDTGVVVGAHPADALIFSEGFDPYAPHDAEVLARYEGLRFVVLSIALAIGPVLAHEMGHAMGLMPVGLPPQGLFAGRLDASIVGPRTNGGHADLPGLNLMQAGGDALSLIQELDQVVERRRSMSLIDTARVLALETRMSPLTRAYLQRKLTYSNTGRIGEAAHEGMDSGH